MDKGKKPAKDPPMGHKKRGSEDHSPVSPGSSPPRKRQSLGGAESAHADSSPDKVKLIASFLSKVASREQPSKPSSAYNA